MALFEDWCNQNVENIAKKRLWILSELAGGRPKINEQMKEVVRSHYDKLTNIADAIKDLGYIDASTILKERLPTTKKAKSGDLGEILAAEFTEEKLGYVVPVRRLRYKDGRNLALRGDDFIGLNYANNQLSLLKGESKSRVNLSKSTITSARAALNRDNGCCTAISLLFIADRLLEEPSPKYDLGKIVRNEIGTKCLIAKHISHAFFTLSGNAPIDALRTDLNSADTKRPQHVINIHIPDHENFIAETYKEAGDLGTT